MHTIIKIPLEFSGKLQKISQWVKVESQGDQPR